MPHKDMDSKDHADSTLRFVHSVHPRRPIPLESQDCEITGRIAYPSPDAEAAAPISAVSHITGVSRHSENIAFSEEDTVVFSMESQNPTSPQRVPVKLDYEIKGEIARGGMGKIYTADDPLLKREVAVKMSSAGERTHDYKFTKEAEVLAALEHPNIVPVHNLGFDADGRPFYSMKLVQGQTLHWIIKQLAADEREAATQYPLQRLLDIFRKICDAVSFAHAKGYIHRDLKPENVMVGEFGEVLVMDWGIAKVIRKPRGETLAEAPLEPETLPYVEGTPQYMSPEQANGVYGGLDQRSDIYSLGCLLYSILTLRPPVVGSSQNEVLIKVRNGEIAPITKQRVAFKKEGPAPHMKPVPEALRAMTLKAMSKEPDRRYASVSDLIADIEAYQAGFVTSAESATALRLLILFAKRHKASSILATLLLAGSLFFAIRLMASEKEARESEVKAQEKMRAAQLAESNARKNAARSNIARAEAYEKKFNAEEMQDALKLVTENDLRSQEWRYMNRLLDTSDRTLSAKNGSNWSACVPHPAKPGFFVTLQQDQWLRTLDLNTGETADLFRLPQPCDPRSLAVSPDGMRIAMARTLKNPKGQELTLVEVYNTLDGEMLCAFETPYVADCWLRFNPEGHLLLKMCRRGWVPNSGLLLMDIEKREVRWKREQVDGSYDATFYGPSDILFASKGGLQEIDAITGNSQKLIRPLNLGSFQPIFSEGLLLMHKPSGMRSLDELAIMRYEVNYLTKSVSEPDSARLELHCLPKENLFVKFSKVAEKSAILELRDLKAGDFITSIPVMIDRNQGESWITAASPETGQVAVLRGNRMKVWKFVRTKPNLTFAETFDSATGAVTFLGQTNRLLQVSAAKNNGTRSLEVFEWNAGALTKQGQLEAEVPDGVRDFYSGTSRDGKLLATASYKDYKFSLELYTLNPNSIVRQSRIDEVRGSWGHFALNPNGTQIWTGYGFYDVQTGETRRFESDIRVQALRDSGIWTDNKHLACISVVGNHENGEATSEKGIVLLNSSLGTLEKWRPAPSARRLAASPDGLLLAEGGADQKVRIRDATTLEVVQTLRAHDAPVIDLTWHPKLPYLATVGEDLKIRIWDPKNEVLVEEIGILEEMPTLLLWSPDGQTLLVRGIRNRFLFNPESSRVK